MNSNSSSPRFGLNSDRTFPDSPKGKSLGKLKEARKARARAARTEGLPSLRAFNDDDGLKGLDHDRADVSVSLSLRYMQLREVVARDKHSLRRLREEHARLQDSLKSLQGKSKQGDIDRNRLNAMKTALFAITETQKKHNIESDEMKLALIKKELGSVMEWNSHVAAMVAFLQAQQGPVMKQQVAPVVKTQSRSKSPIRHWTP
jgi:hypothetical protein